MSTELSYEDLLQQIATQQEFIAALEQQHAKKIAAIQQEFRDELGQQHTKKIAAYEKRLGPRQTITINDRCAYQVGKGPEKTQAFALFLPFLHFCDVEFVSKAPGGNLAYSYMLAANEQMTHLNKTHAALVAEAEQQAEQTTRKIRTTVTHRVEDEHDARTLEVHIAHAHDVLAALGFTAEQVADEQALINSSLPKKRRRDE